MPNRFYRKGYNAERKSRAWLESQGYFVVEARGSHGALDLVAIGYAHLRVVQVKSGRKPSPSEIHEIKAAMRKLPPMPLMVRELHYWKDYAREPHVEVL